MQVRSNLLVQRKHCRIKSAVLCWCRVAQDSDDMPLSPAWTFGSPFFSLIHHAHWGASGLPPGIHLSRQANISVRSSSARREARFCRKIP